MNGVPRSDSPRRVLVLTGGHSVDLDALFAMMDAIGAERGWRWAHARQPSAQAWLDESSADAWDAVLLHDIPGLAIKRGQPPAAHGPAPAVRDALVSMLRRGLGLVVTHHSLAAWPLWDGWARAVGGRFLYAPGELRGVSWPSSGTRITDYTARVVAPDHPVCAGVDDFSLLDELYCCPIFEDEVVPLMRAEADMDGRQFVSTYEHVLVGEHAAPDCSGHPPVSNLIAWATVAERSPIAYIQPGDTGGTFGLPQYRRLVGNALDWVSSSAAHEWAESRPVPLESTTAQE